MLTVSHAHTGSVTHTHTNAQSHTHKHTRSVTHTHTHTLSHTHRSRCGRTQTFSNNIFSAAPQFYQWNSLITQELHYISQQGTGNIIVSEGIKATALLLRWSFIHTQHLSLSLSHKWTLDELHFSDNRILKWRSLNC